MIRKQLTTTRKILSLLWWFMKAKKDLNDYIIYVSKAQDE